MLQSEQDDLETLVGYVNVANAQLIFKVSRTFTSARSYSNGESIILTNVERQADYPDLYSAQTGTFLVPFSGNYSFTLEFDHGAHLSHCSSNTHHTLIAAYNGEEIAEHWNFRYNYDRYNSGSRYLCSFAQTWQMTLNEGDEVTIRSIGDRYNGVQQNSEMTWTGSFAARFEN